MADEDDPEEEAAPPSESEPPEIPQHQSRDVSQPVLSEKGTRSSVQSATPSATPNGIPSAIPSATPSATPNGVQSAITSATASTIPSTIPSGEQDTAQNAPQSNVQSVTQSVIETEETYYETTYEATFEAEIVDSNVSYDGEEQLGDVEGYEDVPAEGSSLRSEEADAGSGNGDRKGEHLRRTKLTTRGRDNRLNQRQFLRMIGRHEMKNEELGKREGDLRNRLDVLECSMPAVLVWNIWRMAQGNRVGKLRRIIEKHFRDGFSCCPITPSQHYDCRVREVEAERKYAQKRAEEARALWCEKATMLEDRRKMLEEAKKVQEEQKAKLQELRAEAQRLKDELLKMDDACVAGECGDIGCRERLLGKVSSSTSICSADVECLEKLQQLAENEICTKRQITELERREDAYMCILQQADELWGKMEGDTASTVSALQELLDTKTATNQQLADRVVELEDQLEKCRERMARCRTELEKFMSIDKIEAAIGRDSDLAGVSDKGVAATSVLAHKGAGGDDDMAGTLDEETLAKIAGVDEYATAGPDLSELGVGPEAAYRMHAATDATGEDIAYELEKQRELEDYFAQLGDISELYTDDVPCPPDFVCNDVVESPTGLTPEELRALETLGSDVDLGAVDMAALKQEAEGEGKECPPGFICNDVVETATGMDAAEATEPALTSKTQVSSAIPSQQDVAETFPETFSDALEGESVVDKESEMTAMTEDIGMPSEEAVTAQEVILDPEVGESVHTAGEDRVEVPRSELLSWLDTSNLIRGTIANCPNCSPIKVDVDDMAERIAMYAGVKPAVLKEEPVVSTTGISLKEEEITEQLLTGQPSEEGMPQMVEEAIEPSASLTAEAMEAEEEPPPEKFTPSDVITERDVEMDQVRSEEEQISVKAEPTEPIEAEEAPEISTRSITHEEVAPSEIVAETPKSVRSAAEMEAAPPEMKAFEAASADRITPKVSKRDEFDSASAVKESLDGMERPERLESEFPAEPPTTPVAELYDKEDEMTTPVDYARLVEAEVKRSVAETQREPSEAEEEKLPITAVEEGEQPPEEAEAEEVREIEQEKIIAVESAEGEKFALEEGVDERKETVMEEGVKIVEGEAAPVEGEEPPTIEIEPERVVDVVPSTEEERKVEGDVPEEEEEEEEKAKVPEEEVVKEEGDEEKVEVPEDEVVKDEEEVEKVEVPEEEVAKEEGEEEKVEVPEEEVAKVEEEEEKVVVPEEEAPKVEGEEGKVEGEEEKVEVPEEEVVKEEGEEEMVELPVTHIEEEEVPIEEEPEEVVEEEGVEEKVEEVKSIELEVEAPPEEKAPEEKAPEEEIPEEEVPEKEVPEPLEKIEEEPLAPEEEPFREVKAKVPVAGIDPRLVAKPYLAVAEIEQRPARRVMKKVEKKGPCICLICPLDTEKPVEPSKGPSVATTATIRTETVETEIIQIAIGMEEPMDESTEEPDVSQSDPAEDRGQPTDMARSQISVTIVSRTTQRTETEVSSTEISTKKAPPSKYSHTETQYEMPAHRMFPSKAQPDVVEEDAEGPELIQSGILQAEAIQTEVVQVEAIRTEVCLTEAVQTKASAIASAGTQTWSSQGVDKRADSASRQPTIKEPSQKSSAKPSQASSQRGYTLRSSKPPSTGTSTVATQTDRLSRQEDPQQKIPSRRDMLPSTKSNASSRMMYTGGRRREAVDAVSVSGRYVDAEEEVRALTYRTRPDDARGLDCDCCTCGKAALPAPQQLVRRFVAAHFPMKVPSKTTRISRDPSGLSKLSEESSRLTRLTEESSRLSGESSKVSDEILKLSAGSSRVTEESSKFSSHAMRQPSVPSARISDVLPDDRLCSECRILKEKLMGYECKNLECIARERDRKSMIKERDSRDSRLKDREGTVKGRDSRDSRRDDRDSRSGYKDTDSTSTTRERKRDGDSRSGYKDTDSASRTSRTREGDRDRDSKGGDREKLRSQPCDSLECREQQKGRDRDTRIRDTDSRLRDRDGRDGDRDKDSRIKDRDSRDGDRDRQSRTSERDVQSRTSRGSSKLRGASKKKVTEKRDQSSMAKIPKVKISGIVGKRKIDVSVTSVKILKKTEEASIGRSLQNRAEEGEKRGPEKDPDKEVTQSFMSNVTRASTMSNVTDDSECACTQDDEGTGKKLLCGCGEFDD